MLCKMLRALIDPNVAPVRSLARDERELMIAANSSHVLAYDNLSGLLPWLSDALCRIASGASRCGSCTPTTRKCCSRRRKGSLENRPHRSRSSVRPAAFT